jgi:sulfate permease, SulP family
VRRWISVLDWLPRYRGTDLAGDVVAGLTGAAVLVPQSMAYAQIAHLPPVVALYASVVPLIVYAVHPGLRTIVVDASGVNHLDATADHELRKLAARYRERGITLLLVNVADDVRPVMDASGLTELIGADRFFANDADAFRHLAQRAA